MAHKINKSSFRTAFRIVNKDIINWFPGHMGLGLKQMQQKLKLVDLVIEVHDSRIPLSGRNPNFKHTISAIKPHILILNKKDLTDNSYNSQVIKRLREEEQIKHVLYTNCKDQTCSGIKRIMPLAKELITNSDRFNRADNKEFCIMVIGVPNVGKSSIINVLRNRHLKKKGASHVGAVAGITRSVLNRIKIAEDPPIYLLDTPGILMPNIKDTETGMKLALCSCLQDHQVGPINIADYLLFWMNQNENYSYVDLLGLQEPSDDIAKVLLTGANFLEKTIVKKRYDNYLMRIPHLEAAAIHMIKAFRTGSLGKVFLDNNFFPKKESNKIETQV